MGLAETTTHKVKPILMGYYKRAEKHSRLNFLRTYDQTTVAAFDLINEPTTSPTSATDAWQTLAQQLVNEIRTVDANHMLVVEEDYNTSTLFLVQDPLGGGNILYERHFYYPDSYTHNTGMNGRRGVPTTPLPPIPIPAAFHWPSPV